MYPRIARVLVADTLGRAEHILGTTAISEERVTEESQLLCQFVNNKPAAIICRHLPSA
jgi:hypothetical protein